ncbi:MAG: nucleotidyl transferase AbiEii/AbiGii toxin family protein [Acidobacteria bacterium]|nr:nucleotidyl transferase AbiEii/AbiGii toxin family protein [Acidobacteriota bacterium]
MDDAHDGDYAREPQVEDVVRLCQALNERSARYLLIGGFAVIAHGGARTTKDIDLLIDASPANLTRVKAALGVLSDNAAAEIADNDVERYTVVRVADEVVVDLMARACGLDYDAAMHDVEYVDIDGVSIPVASPATLIRTKDTIRPSDAADRAFLRKVLDARRLR